jgi:hypothetical protein
MGGWWIQPGGDGVYSFALSTPEGDFFALENDEDFGCSTIFYATLSDTADTLSGSGFTAQSGTGETATGGPCQYTAAIPITYAGTVTPTVSIDLGVYGITQSDLTGEYQNGTTLSNGNYATPANVQAIAGAYPMLSGDTFTVGQNGAVSLSEAATGCTYTGTVSVIDPAYSVYQLQVTPSGCTATPAWNGVLQTGIITFLGSDIDGPGVFGGTQFIDNTGTQQLKLFQ